MKNKAGKIGGFVVGFAGFLLLFKLFILSRVSPGDELAPGIVMLAAVLNGILFAFLGGVVQHSFVKKQH